MAPTLPPLPMLASAAPLPEVPQERLCPCTSLASAPCGVSIVSAYATGIGAVLAIDARVWGSVSLAPHAACAGVDEGAADCSTAAYLRECVGCVLDLCAHPFPPSYQIKTASNVPSGVGLKSSSAVATALIAALLAALARPWSATDAVRVATEAARRTHHTQAGSLDDTYAAVLGGVVVADAHTQSLIERWPAPEDIEVCVLVLHQPRPRVHALDRCALLRPYAAKMETLLNRLLAAHDVFAVMTEAAFIHTRAFGYPEEPLHAALAAGALAVSLSGKGPAIAALAKVGTGQHILAAWHRFGPSWVLRTRPTNTGVLATSRTRHSQCALG